MTAAADITGVLAELDRGAPDAAERLLPIVYEELRRLADRYLRDEPAGQTLQPTALVHEAFLRLVGGEQATWEDRTQFFSVAAQAMRRLLIDHARRRRAAKRGGARHKLSLSDVAEPAADRDEYLVALDEALVELSRVDPDVSRVVELRFFGGLSIEEAAQVLGVSSMTVKRRWKLARGWLHREIVNGI
jgi:RNA polymerase sigma factor (TIGR02999 family)